ncbi:MAG: glycosyltransferase family 4 protein [Promethearchaeota archaeon]
MRILMVVTDIFFMDFSGGSRRTYETARGFLSKGHEVIVFSNRQPGMKKFEIIEGIKIYRRKMIEPGKIIGKMLSNSPIILRKTLKKVLGIFMKGESKNFTNNGSNEVHSHVSRYDDFHSRTTYTMKAKLADFYRHKFPLLKFIKTWPSIFRILKIIKKEKIDVIYERGGSYGIGVLCANLTGRINFTEFIDILYWNWALKKTDVITSYFTKSHVPGFIERDKIKLVYTSVDPDRFNPDIPVLEVKRKYNLKEEDFIGVYVGAFYSWHGLENVVDAFNLLMESAEFEKLEHLREHLKIILVGNGETFGIIKEKVSKNFKLKNKIILTGRVPFNEVPAYVNAASFCLTLNEYDAIGLKTFEYMACAKPLISTDVDLVPYFFKDGVNILLIPPNNPRALIEKIAYLYEHPDERKRIGQNARALVEQKYTWSKHIDNLLDAIKMAINKKRK